MPLEIAIKRCTTRIQFFKFQIFTYPNPSLLSRNMSSVISIDLHPGYRGFVTGVVNAQYAQRAEFKVYRAGAVGASATFEGQGVRVHLKDVFNNREYWSFGPFNFQATLQVTISHHRGGQYVPSKMVGPLSIRKAPEPDYPIQFYQSTVVSEDSADQSHDDCTFVVLQYKEPGN
ncbi:hypothetical protein C8J56DRAFT_1037631 [Mycena floridula]|nr:hypothetical protein C8J56DRAFT_1037631 [Mycena floridula]